MTCTGCKEMPPRYIHLLTVEKPGTNVDAAGQPDLADDANWVAVFQMKANFITKGGKEAYVFKQTQADTTTVIVTQVTGNTPLINPSWRIRWGARKFEIIAAYKVNETGKVFQIEAKEAR